MNAIRELIVDAYGCKSDLNDVSMLKQAALKAAAAVGAKVAESVAHPFQPHGVTVCLILKESHLIISTWPEYSLCIVNVFLCNPKMNARKCWDVLSTILNPTHCTYHEVEHQVQKNKKAA